MKLKWVPTIFLLSAVLSGCIPDYSSFSFPSDFDLLIQKFGIDKSTRFAVIGDYGLAGDPEAKVAELVLDWQPDFIITTGDNNYPDGEAETIEENIEQYFGEYILSDWEVFNSEGLENRFFPSLGNHDMHVEEGKPYFDYFRLPGNERYYQFSWDTIDFFVVNSNEEEPDGITADSVQAIWLKNALSSSSAEWKIVYFHHAPYTSGKHGPTSALQWLFHEWGTDIVISGHDHTYERLVVDDLIYIINGLGGNGRYLFDKIHPGSQFRYNERYGAMFVRRTKNVMVFWFVNIQGEVIDTFQIPH